MPGQATVVIAKMEEGAVAVEEELDLRVGVVPDMADGLFVGSPGQVREAEFLEKQSQVAPAIDQPGLVTDP